MKGCPLVVALLGACLINAPFVGHTQNEQTTQAASVTEDFPSKPDGLTNLPTIGLPSIVIMPDLVSKLGGPDATNMMVSSISDLLIKSGRFTLTFQTNPVFECQVILNDLQIQQENQTHTGGFPSGLAFFTNIFNKLNPVGQSNSIDWSQNETKMNVSCEVSVYIVDPNTKNVIADGEGEVKQTDTTKNINMEIAGFTTSNGQTNEVTTNTVSLQSHLIKLASYYALTNMLPQLDIQLLERPQIPPAPPQEAKAETDASPESAKDALKYAPGKVLAVPDKTIVIVSLGSKNGLKSGDKLNLYEAIDYKDDKGDVVYTQYKLVGEVTLDDVQEERSKAIYAGDVDVKTGWVVKAK